MNLAQKNKRAISFEAKRNLITHSSEFYDLSYEYINDCLRALLVFRREFYNDLRIRVRKFIDVQYYTFSAIW